MNTSSTVQFGWLQKPQVETCEVAKGHRVPEKVLLQCTLLLVKCLFFLLNMLFDQTLPVVVEMFEYKCLLIRVCWLVITLRIGCDQSLKLLLTLSVFMTVAVGSGKQVGQQPGRLSTHGPIHRLSVVLI